ncbi:MAG: hypothetical protein IK066_11270 [Kiritimatiellae bacterium]|nr:hypothetical protein [Kiritimatiellia bacterium]
MKKLLSVLLSLFLPLCAASASAAAFSPLQIGAGWPAPAGFDLQLVSRRTPVFGLRLNLLGSRNDTVAGLDFGICSDAGTFSGIRLNALSGSKTLNGVAVALLDFSHDVRGVQIGGSNFGLGEVRGTQIGLLNFAFSLRGAQIGIVNVADDLCGVQIGLVNIAMESDYPFSPFLRASF